MRWLWNKSQSWLIVTPILREKAIGLILASFAGIYLLFSFFEIPLWLLLFVAIAQVMARLMGWA